MTYAIEDLLENIAGFFNKGLPFVAFKSPDENKVHLLWQNTDALHYVTPEARFGFVMATYSHEKTPYLLKPEGYMNATFDPIISSINPEKAPLETDKRGSSNVLDHSNALKVSHMNLVQSALDEIGRNQFKKVVLARATSFETAKTPLAIFENLLACYDSAFCYLWHHPALGTWIGATPERLLRIENKTLQTAALAGTIKRDDTSTSLFSENWTLKEQEEQAMVVQDIENRLASAGLKVNKNNTYQVNAAQVSHLKTDISVAQIGHKTLVELIETLHPSPAICGLPRDQAQDFIQQNEALDRKFYAGYLGLVHAHLAQASIGFEGLQSIEADLYVNLRCMEYQSGTAIVYVGSGITSGSQPEKEWEETILKAQTIKKVI
ncbi:MAG: isochorismate synthase [Flavobacteriaceae bacterium]|nr:isochorismate synthase [Flavobacteriaceae bacterium]MDC6456955.1 isochorismate synthase [Flavobacteriaceae bacterium]MDO7587355.1 isochorismate synthase [Flavobacteriaceae bacterium]MDO7619738.1 isochorismate synthase [Flavobacteriaceae bacterium]